MKLVVREPEPAALAAALDDVQLLTSTLALVEVPRAHTRRAPEPAWSAARVAALARLRLVDLDQRVLTRAGRLAPGELRSGDAVHLASALAVGVEVVVVYDRRLADAVRAQALSVLAPGQAR